MKEIFISAFAIAPSALCVAAAFALAYKDGWNGWGWFLFMAFLLYPNLKFSQD